MISFRFFFRLMFNQVCIGFKISKHIHLLLDVRKFQKYCIYWLRMPKVDCRVFAIQTRPPNLCPINVYMFLPLSFLQFFEPANKDDSGTLCSVALWRFVIMRQTRTTAPRYFVILSVMSSVYIMGNFLVFVILVSGVREW